MPPEQQTTHSLPRGRTQAAKPLAAATSASGVAAPTASTRAKVKPQTSAPASAEKRPARSVPATTKTSASSTTANTTPHAGTTSRQARPRTAPGAPTKSKSQPIRASSLKKEPFKETATEDATKGVTSSENTANVQAAQAVSDDGKPAPPVVIQEEAKPGASEPMECAPQAAPPTRLPSTSDPLQVAAQTYPWLYMNSTLDACFADAERTAEKQLDEFEKQITENEAQLADEKLRYDNERLIEFCDELGSDTFAKEAPAIMQSFISFGEVCERVEAEALQLAMSTPSLDSEEPLHAYSAMMDNLDELQDQASELESSILRLTSSGPNTIEVSAQEDLQASSEPGTKDSGEQDNGDENEGGGMEKEQKLLKDANTARAQIIGVFAACLPVLRARIANLSMAQELIDSAQENFSLALRMESMGIE